MRCTDKCVFYGFEVVRRELSRTPRNIRFGGAGFRRLLLENYDLLVGNHSFESNFLIESLAHEYMRHYRGGKPAQSLLNDFLIVACASFHDMDIVVSEDRATMLSKNALRTYREVNTRTERVGMPRFLTTAALEALV